MSSERHDTPIYNNLTFFNQQVYLTICVPTDTTVGIILISNFPTVIWYPSESCHDQQRTSYQIHLGCGEEAWLALVALLLFFQQLHI